MSAQTTFATKHHIQHILAIASQKFSQRNGVSVKRSSNPGLTRSKVAHGGEISSGATWDVRARYFFAIDPSEPWVTKLFSKSVTVRIYDAAHER